MKVHFYKKLQIFLESKKSRKFKKIIFYYKQNNDSFIKLKIVLNLLPVFKEIILLSESLKSHLLFEDLFLILKKLMITND